MNEPWTIRRVVRWTTEDFKRRGLSTPRLDAEVLVAHALGADRVRLYLDLDRVLSAGELDAIRAFVQRRRRREPVAYIVGRREFFGRSFRVSKEVLVPRPETELVVERALEAVAPRREPRTVRLEVVAPQVEARRGIETRVEPLETSAESEETEGADAIFVDSQARRDMRGGRARAPGETSDATRGPALRVLDVCTGSGCIGLTLAMELPQADVVLADVSPEALEVARSNLDVLAEADPTLRSRVRLVQSDLFDAIDPRERFDLVTCNPPYLSEADLADCAPEVREHEPRLALVAGPRGDEVLVRLIERAPDCLVPGGRLVTEVGAGQAERVCAALIAAGFVDVRTHRDLGGHERVVEAVTPSRRT